MSTIRIYTRRMALFIKSKGIEPPGTMPDENKPKFLNWIFEDTTELRNAMTEFSAIFYHEKQLWRKRLKAVLCVSEPLTSPYTPPLPHYTFLTQPVSSLTLIPPRRIAYFD